jgi:hypothetical protein
VAGEGGARELAREVSILIWGIGSGGAHHVGLTAVKQVGDGEPMTAGRRRGGGHWLGVRGAAVSSGGGRCGDGGAHRWPEVALDGKAISANEGGGQLSVSAVHCKGRWPSGWLGVAQRHTRAMRGGPRSVLGVEADNERQREVASARRLLQEEERSGFSIGPTVRGEDARGGGCMRCAWRPGGRWHTSERQLARSGHSAGGRHQHGRNDAQTHARKTSDRASF